MTADFLLILPAVGGISALLLLAGIVRFVGWWIKQRKRES